MGEREEMGIQLSVANGKQTDRDEVGVDVI